MRLHSGLLDKIFNYPPQLHRTPTEAEVLKIADRKETCAYFFHGIFQVRKHVLRKVDSQKMDEATAVDRIVDQFNNYYQCMTGASVTDAPELIHDEQIKNFQLKSWIRYFSYTFVSLKKVRHALVNELRPKSHCEEPIDSLFRKLFYNNLI